MTFEGNAENHRKSYLAFSKKKTPKLNQRTSGPVNAHLISWPSKAQDMQNLENIW